jgi:hypothetical protein
MRDGTGRTRAGRALLRWSSAAAALQQATATLPIVFANAVDPVGEG